MRTDTAKRKTAPQTKTKAASQKTCPQTENEIKQFERSVACPKA
jgi:hypothetical protein